MKLFIDTWGWLTLRDRRESRHQEAVTYYRDFRLQHGIAYTSDYVLDETITLLFRAGFLSRQLATLWKTSSRRLMKVI